MMVPTCGLILRPPVEVSEAEVVQLRQLFLQSLLNFMPSGLISLRFKVGRLMAGDGQIGQLQAFYRVNGGPPVIKGINVERAVKLSVTAFLLDLQLDGVLDMSSFSVARLAKVRD